MNAELISTADLTSMIGLLVILGVAVTCSLAGFLIGQYLALRDIDTLDEFIEWIDPRDDDDVA